MSVQRTIVIDPGHGGKDPGAVYGSLQEKTIVLFICLDLGFRLQNLNSHYQTFLTRPTDIFISLGNRAAFANRVKADLFISVHTNADPDLDRPGDPEGKGEEIWIPKGRPDCKIAADAMELWIDMIIPEEPFRGIKESGSLTVLNLCRCACLLIELGFIDKSSSLETFSSMKTLQKISGLLASGIDQYFINCCGLIKEKERG